MKNVKISLVVALLLAGTFIGGLVVRADDDHEHKYKKYEKYKEHDDDDDDDHMNMTTMMTAMNMMTTIMSLIIIRTACYTIKALGIFGQEL